MKKGVSETFNKGSRANRTSGGKESESRASVDIGNIKRLNHVMSRMLARDQNDHLITIIVKHEIALYPKN